MNGTQPLSTLPSNPPSHPHYHSHQILPLPKPKPTIISIPAEDRSKYDIYIENTIAIDPDFVDNASRIATATSLAIYTLCRPLSNQEPTPRSNTISTSNLTAEGTKEEVKVILGWKYDTCSIIIFLPDQKCTAWAQDP